MRMERKWTPAQKSAIDTRDCNVLVSAAAGSGKTAVLVERIISMITDPDKNIDIDRLVVVTFTKAAAAQMKDKIRKALDSMLDENPGDVNLLRQITLLNNAQITTIDSFCLWIIRNHFPEVNLDPGFRIMDEGEKKLIENDVLEDVLEEFYAEADEDGFLVELRCNNTFQVQLFGKIKAYLLENQPAWKAAGAIPIPDAVAMFNLIDQLAGGNRYWSEETGRQAEDALFELQEIIDSLEEA